MIILEIIILVYFVFTTIYALTFFVASLFYRDETFDSIQTVNYKKFCVLIPSYKEDGVIVSVAKSALNQNYPKDLYKVVVIADSLQPQTVEELKKLDIITIVVSFTSSTKVKSLNEAFSQVKESFDYAVILDADNIMEKEFLQKVNYLHSKGMKAIQTQRAPKNATTSISVLDGLSEGINYTLVSKGGIVLKASPGIKGSGMSFDYTLIKSTLISMDSIGGFDRELELRLLSQEITIYYSSDVCIYDEKVEQMEVFKKQRTRWISSQFFYLRKYFTRGMQALVSGNFSYFNSAVLRNIQLPRLINTGLLFILSFLLILLHQYTYFSPLVWVGLVILNTAILFLSIPKQLYSRKLFKAILTLPGVFLHMFLILFKLKGANKKFIHTPHKPTHTS